MNFKLFLLVAFFTGMSFVSATAQTKTPALAPASPLQITMDQFIGANAFIDDPVKYIEAVGFIREYHNWSWDEGGENYKGYPNNAIKWAPGIWNFDDFYRNLKQAHVGVSPCLQGTVSWLQGEKALGHSDKPLDEKGAKATDPNAYEKKAHHLFQFAARYGATKVADRLLTLAPGQPRNSGLNLISYLEDWNEQDKDWEGPNANFSPQEYAAMASANYDGHAKTMKQGSGTFGVKNADPKMKFVMGGLAGLKLDYIAAMKLWFEQNRPDHKFAADVINFHHYAWKDGSGWQGGGPAKSPEEDHFKERMKKLTAYRDKNLPGVEVWISEFGWDTHPKSPLSPPVIGPFDRQEVQGQWLVRAYLAFAAARVDRAQMFMLRDVDPTDSLWFASCGLVGPKGDWKPKKSWYYVYTMKNVLTNMVYLGEELSPDPNMLIYKFKDISSSKGVYVLWAKTKQNYRVNHYKLLVKGDLKSATQIELLTGSTVGKMAILPVKNSEILVNVTERPVFIKVDSIR
ncbi:MAG: hypothetical protein ACOH2A_11235 [Sphingobacteriaceae bacterium]